MRVPELKEYISTVSRSVSVLLIGPPGIGKSVAVREFAEEEAKAMNLEFIEYDDSYFDQVISKPEEYYVYVDMRLTEVEPSDLIGIPRDMNGFVAYKPLTWAMVLSKVRYGLLFLDELTNVQRPDIISAAYKIVLDRRVGFTKLSKGVRVIAAGNSPEHSSVANKIPAPLMSRFHKVDIEAPTVDEWSSWMDSHYAEWDRRVYAYLKRFPEDFIRVPDEPETLKAYPTPRTWTWLADEISRCPEKFMRNKVAGYVGEETGARFIAFISQKIPEPEDMLRNPELFKSLNVDAKYLAIVLVARYVDESLKAKDMPDVLKFTDAVSDIQQEYVLLFLLSLKDKRDKFFNHVMSSTSSKTRKALLDSGFYLASASKIRS